MKQKKLFIALKKKSEISGVFEKGSKLYSNNLLMRFKKVELDQESLPFYVLMALPKKKLGAVKRNRLRRICKSALFHAMTNMFQILTQECNHSFQIVIHARESFNDMTENARILEFENLLKRLLKEND